MSEVTPNELVKRVSFSLRGSNVIPTPIDPTLSNEGEAADAAATGEAIAAVLDDLRVNTKAPVNKAVTIYASDIPMSGEAGAQTVAEALAGVADRDASTIMYDADNMVTVKGALDTINTALDSELTEEEIDGIIEDVFGGDE